MIGMETEEQKSLRQLTDFTKIYCNVVLNYTWLSAPMFSFTIIVCLVEKILGRINTSYNHSYDNQIRWNFNVSSILSILKSVYIDDTVATCFEIISLYFLSVHLCIYVMGVVSFKRNSN